jgi:hypothetical protein
MKVAVDYTWKDHEAFDRYLGSGVADFAGRQNRRKAAIPNGDIAFRATLTRQDRFAATNYQIMRVHFLFSPTAQRWRERSVQAV